jgi:DNA replication and repair protein RecF
MRRKFIDSVISQGNKTYLQTLINYNKVLIQRNALLKYFALNNTFNKDTLSIYNDQLSGYGAHIHKERKVFLEKFIPIFKDRYIDISSGKEKVNLAYQSQLEDKGLGQLLSENLNKDKALQYTSVGTHKDDLIFEIDGHPIKKFGSQGQQKSYLVALKLAQFDFTKQQSGQTPLLLLDDIFDKLDEKRVSQIIALVNKDSFGQIFISDTHRERTENVVKKAEQSYRMIEF